MNRQRLLNLSDRWFRLLLRFYPDDFRDDMGDSLAEAYRDRAREAIARGGIVSLAGVWIRALVDAMRNGPREWRRPAASWRRSGSWIRDAELATRRLMRAPGLVLAVVGTLTVGLGTFAVVYTVVQKILIDPMPYKDDDDLYVVWRDYRPIFDLNRGWLGGTDVVELQRQGGVIQDAVGLLQTRVTFALREGTDPAEIGLIISSPNLFDVLGVRPVIGRGFAPDEVGPKRPPVIVISHQLWNRLGADPSILGTDVRVNGRPYTVIGILAPDFAFTRNTGLTSPPPPAEAFATFDISLADTRPDAGSYGGLIRARAGTPPDTVTAAVAAVGRIIDARDFQGRGVKLYPVGLKRDLVSRARPALLVLGFAAVFLVLVLMVNLALVLLARAAQREHEFAVSRSLGANGVAIARATLIEGGVLGLLGGLAATGVAVWCTRGLVAIAPLDLPRLEAVAVDSRVASVVVGVGVLLGVLAAAVPAIWASRTALSSLLANSSVRGGGGHGRMRSSMVVAQVALSLVLLTIGALVARSFEQLLRADPGFRAEGLLTVRVPMPAQLLPEFADVVSAQGRIERALGGLPGVTSVAATSSLPLTASASQMPFTILGSPGITGDRDRDRPLVDYMGVRGRYIDVIGMRLVAGRSLEENRRDGVHEALIDRHLARHFFPTGDPLGVTLSFNDRMLTIVGVVEQARLYDVHQDGRPQLIVRAEDTQFRTLTFVLRTDREVQALIPLARAAIRDVDPRLAVTGIRTMEEVVADATRQQRVSAVLIAGLALGALLLASMGIFGVMSAAVTRRRHELAVRLALGANHRGVLRLVLGEGVRLVAFGILIGLPGIYLVGGVIRGVLVGISPLDPLTLVSVAAGLAVVAMTACYIPARRVLRIEAAQSLRMQ